MPEEQIQQLCNMLFSAAIEYKNNTSSTRNEVCLAIVSLLIRWNSIENIVGVVVSSIGSSGNDYLLLTILGMLPDEAQSKRVLNKLDWVIDRFQF